MSTTTFRADPSDNLENVVEDTTPQLGGDLDVNTNSIVSTSNGDITLAPDGTGNVVLGVFTLDADQSVGAGQDNYVLTYDNGTGLISLEASSGGISDVVDDTTPQLGGDLDVNGNSIVSVANGDIAITPNGSGTVQLDAAISFSGGTISRVSGTNSFVQINGGTSGDGGQFNAYGSTHSTYPGKILIEQIEFLNGAVSEIDSATFANAGGGSDPVLSSNSASQLLDLTGNLTISGDLTVSGTTVTVNTATYDVEDPLINLGHNNTSSHAVDLGFYGTYDPAGTDLYCGLFFDATDDKWKLYKDSQGEPTTTVNTGATGHATATLVADIEGDVTGTVSDISNHATTGLSNVTAGTGTGTTIVFNTSPTIVTPTIASFTNSTHDHSNAAGGGTLNASSIASGTLTHERGGLEADVSAFDGVVRITGGATSALSFLDEDTMSSDSATAVASQQSIKAYVDQIQKLDILLTPGSVKFPASNPGALDQSGTHDLIAFDDTTSESVYWSNLRATNYGGGTLSADICYSMAGANTSKTVEFGVSVYAISDGDSADLDTLSLDTENTQSLTCPDTAGYPDVATVTLTSKDSVADGDLLYIKVERNPSGTDTAVGDAELRWVRIYES